MDDKMQKQYIANKIDNVCEEMDSIRSLLSRSAHELESNILCGKTLGSETVHDINNDIVDIVNDLEILESKLQIESSNI